MTPFSAFDPGPLPEGNDHDAAWWRAYVRQVLDRAKEHYQKIYVDISDDRLLAYMTMIEGQVGQAITEENIAHLEHRGYLQQVIWEHLPKECWPSLRDPTLLPDLKELLLALYGCYRTQFSSLKEENEILARQHQMRDTIIEEYREEVARLENERDIRRREQKEETWVWQGDGEDVPETLSCPVIMQAETLRGMLKRITDLEHEVAKESHLHRMDHGLADAWRDQVDHMEKILDNIQQQITQYLISRGGK